MASSIIDDIYCTYYIYIFFLPALIINPFSQISDFYSLVISVRSFCSIIKTLKKKSNDESKKHIIRIYDALWTIKYALLTWAMKMLMNSLLYTEKWLPLWGQRFDQEDPYCADGHSSDEGAWERPRDVDWPSVQPGQVLRHHARAQEDVARVHGQDPPQIRKLLRGRGSHSARSFYTAIIIYHC